MPAAGVPPVAMRTGIFYESLLPLQCPVSFYGAIPGFFKLSIDSVGNKHSKNHNPKRGQRLKLRTRAKAKGQSRLVPPGGFLRGEQFERERVVPPLSRLLCLLSCRSKKVRPPAGRTSRFNDSTQLKKFMVSIPTRKYQPQNKPELHRPLAPSVTCGASSLPEGAMGCVPLHIGLLLFGKCLL